MSQKFKNKNKLKMLIWQKDSLYNSWWFHKFISKLMFSGKKFSIEKKLYFSLYRLKKGNKMLPFYLFMHFFEKIKPFLSTISKRLGRKFYLVPVPIRIRRQYIVGLDWIIQSIRAQKHKNITLKIISELDDIFSNPKAGIYKRRNQHFKTITESRVYSRYRWV